MTSIAPETAAYISDIQEQPAALRRLAEAELPDELAGVDLRAYDRIILTGMGCSDFAAVPTERRLAAAGLPVLRIDAGQLLDVPDRVTRRSLLWVTSQSGRSGEIAALADQLTGPRQPATVIAATDDPASPVADLADLVLELHSGPESSVSSKSYLNSLAVHQQALAVLTGDARERVDEEIRGTAAQLDDLLAEWPEATDLARTAWNAERARFAFAGIGDDAASALTGALIMKESTKIPVEGYVGGAFRHGPFELAGPGLTIVLFGPGGAEDPFLPGLAQDLSAVGSTVITVGPRPYGDSVHLTTGANPGTLARLAVGAVRVQLLTLAFAAATGAVPGRFSFGAKVTAEM